MTFVLLPEFEQDSPEWHEARTRFLGASEVAAILGLSPWQTPLQVYRSKMGVPNEIPENLAYFGHALEAPIAQWIEDKNPEVGVVCPGVSVQSAEFPWLSATPDRLTWGPGELVSLPDDIYSGATPIELKTSSAYSKDKWAEGVPTYYQVQSLVQQAILGADFGWLAVLHGGNDPELYRIPFDPVVWDQIVRITGEWWEAHVVAQVPPEPTTLAEIAEVFPSESGLEIDGSEVILEALDRRVVLLSDAKAMKDEADAIQLAIAQYMGPAELLTRQGTPVLSYKTQNGRTTVDSKKLQSEHPDIYAQVTKTGDPFKVMRTLKVKE